MKKSRLQTIDNNFADCGKIPFSRWASQWGLCCVTQGEYCVKENGFANTNPLLEFIYHQTLPILTAFLP